MVTHHTPSRSDEELLERLVAALETDPLLRACSIRVHVSHDTITLSGWVDSYMKRWAAGRAAQRVAGDRAVANHLEIRVPEAVQRSDAEIADDAAIALDASGARTIEVSVEDGVVTLEGAVEWNFERDDAERVVRNLPGVTGVHNHLAVRARALLAELVHQITKRNGRS
jgi:osmotically-inducible protein OsmY